MIEALAPVDLRETSVTERADFRLCRRRWFLGTVKRLQPAGGSPHFWFGNLIHYALEHYYLGQMEDDPEPEEYAFEAYEKFAKESLIDIAQELGFLWDQAVDEYQGMVEMGRAMLRGYFLMERETGGMGEVVAVEERYRVPIRTASGRAYPGKPLLTGRFDLVVSRPDGTLWVIDHKTAGSKHSSAYLDIDDQLTGYAYVWWRHSGVIPRGQVYNVLLKKAPGPPRLLKNNTLSTAKDQNTTYTLYLQEIKRLRLKRADYQEHLDYLKDKGWGDYYIQEGVFRNIHQLLEFEQNLAHEWRDMREVAAHPERAYPSPSPISCPSCPVKLICATMQDRGDVETIIEEQFTVAPPRR